MTETTATEALRKGLEKDIAVAQTSIEILEAIPDCLEVTSLYMLQGGPVLNVQGSLPVALSSLPPVNTSDLSALSSFGTDPHEEQYPVRWSGRALKWQAILLNGMLATINFHVEDSSVALALPNIEFFQYSQSADGHGGHYLRKTAPLPPMAKLPLDLLAGRYTEFLAGFEGVTADIEDLMEKALKRSISKNLPSWETFRELAKPRGSRGIPEDQVVRVASDERLRLLYEFVVASHPPFDITELNNTAANRALDAAEAACRELFEPMSALPRKNSVRWDLVEHYIRKKTAYPVSVGFRGQKMSYTKSDVLEISLWLHLAGWNRGHTVEVSTQLSPIGFDWDHPDFIEFQYPPRKS